MSDGPPLRVLVVDDDADQRELVTSLLTKAGHDVVAQAVDGHEALTQAIVHQPDLLVLDLALPGRSGLDLLPELVERCPTCRVVVLSGLPRARLGDVALARGAVGYVEKRVAPERLAHEVVLAAALAEAAAEPLTAQLPAALTSAQAARRLVRGALADAGDEVLAAVELLVSELVANAVLHASSAPALSLHLTADLIRVEVRDDDPTLPQRRVPDRERPGGRGLHLLDRAAARWGADPVRDGKVVWFEVERRMRSPRPQPRPAGG